MELNDLTLGFEQSEGGEGSRIKDGEFVDVIIIDKAYDTGYLNDLENRNALEQMKKEALGQSFTPEAPSAKEGGIAFDYAVLRRSTDGVNWKYCFGKGELVEPSYVVYGRVNQPIPKTIEEKKIYPMIFVPTGDLDSKGLPVIKQIMPSVYEAAHWEKNNGRNERVFTASEMPASYVDTAIGLKVMQKEQERRQAWEGIISNWDGLSEEECIDYLQSLLARRYLIARQEGSKLKFLEPDVGTMFRAQVNRYKPDSKYLDIRAMDNRGKVVHNVFTNFEARRDSETIGIAESLIELKLKNIERRAEERAKDSGDSPPF